VDHTPFAPIIATYSSGAKEFCILAIILPSFPPPSLIVYDGTTVVLSTLKLGVLVVVGFDTKFSFLCTTGSRYY
jgi:hypothetical protein